MTDDCANAAYAAGFIDGEGGVRVLSPRPGVVSLQVAAYQNDRRPLDWLVEHYGGKVSEGRPGQHQWRLHGHNAVPFLKLIRPFLKVKGEAVDRAMATWDARPNPRGPRGTGPRKRLT